MLAKILALLVTGFAVLPKKALCAPATITVNVSGTVVAGGGALMGSIPVPLAPGQQISGLTLELIGESPFGGGDEPISVTEQTNTIYGAGYIEHNLTLTETDELRDELELSSEGQSATALAADTTITGSPFEISSYFNGSEYVITNETVVTTGYYGGATATIYSFAASALMDISKNGNIPYSISALKGEFDPTLIAQYTVSAAPEPSQWCLMIFGIGAVGGYLRFTRSQRTNIEPS